LNTTLNKKKVSFDIEPKLLSDIKLYCTENNIKQSTFFRDAAKEKLERDKSFLTILVPLDGTIKKFLVSRAMYDIDIFDASEQMQTMVGARKEGVLRIKKGFEDKADETLKKIVDNFDKVSFFVR